MIGLLSHHHWKLRPGKQLSLPYRQFLKRTTPQNEEAKSPKWQAEDPIAPGLPAWDEANLISPSPPELSTTEPSPSECDTYSVTESDHQTTSYWHGSDPFLPDPISSNILDPERKKIHRVPSLFNIQEWLDSVVDGFIGCTIDGGEGGKPPEVPNQEPQQAAGQPSPSNAAPKRMGDEISRPGNGGNESDSSKDIHRPKRQRAVEEPSSRFACPFFKRNPHRYMGNRTCAGPGWTTTHRVKEHLYRRHMLARFSCPRCHITLTSHQLLTAHLKMATPCTVHEGDPLEGVSPEVERELRKRSRFKTEEKKWLHMYQLLFPDDDAVSYPTPYYEYANESAPANLGVDTGLYDKQIDLILEYEDFLCDDLPQEIQDELQNEVDQRLGACETTVKTCVIDLARNLQLRLLHSFLDQRGNQEEEGDEKIEQGTLVNPTAAFSDLQGEVLLASAETTFPDVAPEKEADDFLLSGSVDDEKGMAEDAQPSDSIQPPGDFSIRDVENVPFHYFNPPTSFLLNMDLQSKGTEGLLANARSLGAGGDQIEDDRRRRQAERKKRNAEAAVRFRKRKREQEDLLLHEKRIQDLEAQNRALEEKLIRIMGADDRRSPLGNTLNPPTRSPQRTGRLNRENTGYASSRASSTGSISSAFGAAGGATKLSFPCTSPGCNAGPFSTQSLLDSHIIVHTDERPYHCSVSDCPRGKEGLGFKRKNELNRHQLVHVTDRVFTCPYCPGQVTKFKRWDGYTRHFRTCHPEIDPATPVLPEGFGLAMAFVPTVDMDYVPGQEFLPSPSGFYSDWM